MRFTSTPPEAVLSGPVSYVAVPATCMWFVGLSVRRNVLSRTVSRSYVGTGICDLLWPAGASGLLTPRRVADKGRAVSWFARAAARHRLRLGPRADRRS